MTRERRCILRSDDLHAPMPGFSMRKIPSAWFLVEKRSWCGNTCSRMNATVRAICCRLEICNLFAVSAANQQALKARVRGRGERIPHQDFAATELRGNFWLPGRILPCGNCAFHFVLTPRRSLFEDVEAVLLPPIFARRRVGYKLDISKAKCGYKVDTIISNL